MTIKPYNLATLRHLASWSPDSIDRQLYATLLTLTERLDALELQMAHLKAAPQTGEQL